MLNSSKLRAGQLRALLGLLLAAACSPDDLSPRELERPAPEAFLDQVAFEGYSQGRREVEVRADSALVLPEDRLVELTRVRIGFQDPSRGPIRVEAAHARLRLDSDDFTLAGGVTGSTGEGEAFFTEEVRYDQAGERLWTTHPVRLVRSDLELTASRMDLHVPTRNLRLRGGVRARTEPGG